MSYFQSPIHGEVFVDWLRAKIPQTPETFRWLEKRFGEYKARKGGYGGYSHSASLPCGGLLAWSPNRPENKVLLELSSKALATLGMNSKNPAKIVDLIAGLRIARATFRRIDIAIDDTRGLLDLDRIWDKIDAGEFTTRFRKQSRLHSYQRILSREKVGDIVAQGDTIYLGRRGSETFIRFYNKRMQALTKERDPEALKKIPKHWVRCEIEIKGDRADYIGRYFETIDYQAQIRRYVEFREPTSKRIRRGAVSPWWLEFLKNADKGPPLFPRRTPSLESLEQWLNNVSGALALMDEVSGGLYMDEILARGRDKLIKNPTYQALMANHNWQRAEQAKQRKARRKDEDVDAGHEAAG